MGEVPDEGRVLVLAEQVKNLLMFAGMLIPDMDLLEQVAQQSSEIRSHTDAMAPIFGAVGMDWEEKSMEAEIHRERAYALLNLVEVLATTEERRTEFRKYQQAKATARAQLGGILGL